MENTFKRKSQAELTALMEKVDSFEFDTEHGFTECTWGAAEDLRHDETVALIKRSTDMFQAIYRAYKLGFMSGMEYAEKK